MPYGNVPPIVHMIPPEVVGEAFDRGHRHLRQETDPSKRRELEKMLSNALEPSSTQSVWAIRRLMQLPERPSPDTTNRRNS
jgi:hypothetical protein